MGIKLSKQYFELENYIFVGTIYVPPEKSIYSNYPLESLQDQILKFDIIGNIMVIDDFNVGNQCDVDNIKLHSIGDLSYHDTCIDTPQGMIETKWLIVMGVKLLNCVKTII